MSIIDKQNIVFSGAYSAMLKRYGDSLSCHNNKHNNKVIPSFDNDDVERPIDLAEFKKLSEAIIDKTGNYGFGLQIGRQIHPSDYGLVGYALMNCATLMDAIRLATRYKQLLNQGMLAELIRCDKVFHYQLKNKYHMRIMEPAIELDFASAMQFARFLVGPLYQKKVEFISIHFQHLALTSKTRYEDCFHCPVLFNQNVNRIVISEDVLKLPIHGANPQVLSMLIRKLDEREKVPSKVVKLSVRVRRHLEPTLGKDLPDSNAVASHFNMSISAFKKHLQAEHTSYQQICDKLRRDEACRLIAGSNLAIKEVGYELGFTSASAFNRAFKRWMNIGPTEYKKNLSQESLVI